METQLKNSPGCPDLTFDGPIGEEYDLLRLVCPEAGEMSRGVGDFLRNWTPPRTRCRAPLQVLEIGCGTGITTQALVEAGGADQVVTAVDVAPAMLDQARRRLEPWLQCGAVRLVRSDAFAFLRDTADECFDIVASGYVFHNFRESYRRAVIAEVFRVLKPGGAFVNGDRYALDDPLEQLGVVQEEVKRFFRVFSDLQRQDLLESWIVHLFSDESPKHVMRLNQSLESYRERGFAAVTVHRRERNNALVSAEKPWP